MTSPYEEEEAQKRQQADQMPAMVFRYAGFFIGAFGGGFIVRRFELPAYVTYLIAGLLGGAGHAHRELADALDEFR